ncbi:MAG: redoxin domain-containing protein [Candidatus Daviesbacteria bacterium]|nr:redoxin domain-containing protein [Candidatus Daviesbacteria bacterium]
MGYVINNISAPQFPLKDKLKEDVLWLNSQPLNLAILRGKIVLVDFWTYSCINCQRTLPFIKKWWDKYHDQGLVIIGVHTPEFEFEKDPENLKKALAKYNVTWPVVQDNDYQIWESFTNHYWPAKYLIDQNGKIIYNHFGEGDYIETEIKIQSALKEAGFKISTQIVSDFENESGALWKTQTPELYFGSSRGGVKTNPGDNDLSSDQIYTTGEWKQEKEFLQHTGETADLDDLITLKYRAKELFLVMGSANSTPIKVYVTLDGVPLEKDLAGKDIKYDEEKAYIEVTMATLYNLISTKTFGDHILRLSTTSDQLQCFAFTFGS